ncbi:MAG: response regulator transcription factor [Pseudomonadota bacterium]|jgi:DNA-binding NarL/FixJ family response regulator
MQILLADDHALFRDGMSYVLQQLGENVEVLNAANFGDAKKLAQEQRDIRLVLLDLNMPGSEGVQSVRYFHQSFPDIPLVVVSGSEQREDIEKVMEYGAMGFISKMSSGKTMLNALRLVLDGGIYLPPQLLQQSVPKLEPNRVDKRSQNTNKYGLTGRQMEALHYLAQGMSNKEISKHMGLAEGTVKIHIAAIYQVLHVGSRMEAVRAAERLGLLENSPQ